MLQEEQRIWDRIRYSDPNCRHLFKAIYMILSPNRYITIFVAAPCATISILSSIRPFAVLPYSGGSAASLEKKQRCQRPRACVGRKWAAGAPSRSHAHRVEPYVLSIASASAFGGRLDVPTHRPRYIRTFALVIRLISVWYLAVAPNAVA